jgi:hypothetical protein
MTNPLVTMLDSIARKEARMTKRRVTVRARNGLVESYVMHASAAHLDGWRLLVRPHDFGSHEAAWRLACKWADGGPSPYPIKA